VAPAVVKAVKKDRIQLAVMPGQGGLLRAVMDYLPGPGPALNRAARATRRKILEHRQSSADAAATS
jgi:hypothetical protein